MLPKTKTQFHDREEMRGKNIELEKNEHKN